MFDFQALADLPSNYIILGALLSLIKWLVNKIDQDQAKFLEALNKLSSDTKKELSETNIEVRKLNVKVESIANDIKNKV